MLKSTKIKIMQKGRELNLKSNEVANQRRRLDFEREQAEEELAYKKDKLAFKKYTDSRVNIPLKELEELKEENKSLKKRLSNCDEFYMAMFHSMDVLCKEHFGDESPVEAIISAIKDGKVEFVGANLCEDNLIGDPFSQNKVYMFKVKFNAR